MKFIRVSVNVLVHPGRSVLACPGKCVSCPCMIVLVHLTVLATAITTLSGLQFQREKLKWEWKGRRKTSKLVKFSCEESLMRIILIIPDEGNRKGTINLSFSLHNNLLNGEGVPLPKIFLCLCVQLGCCCCQQSAAGAYITSNRIHPSWCAYVHEHYVFDVLCNHAQILLTWPASCTLKFNFKSRQVRFICEAQSHIHYLLGHHITKARPVCSNEAFALKKEWKT